MSERQSPDPQQQQQGPKKISIDMPKDLQAVYANVALISHTPVEIVIDFAQVLPRMHRGKVQSRVIMTPMHAKMLQMALAQNIKNYEKQFGEIRLPSRANPLADNFFRFSERGDDDDKE